MAKKPVIEVPEVDTRIDQALAHVKKSGASLTRLDGPPEAVQVLSSGSLALDCALGVGGYPHGRVIEVFGAESSSKTTLTLHAVAHCQAAGGVACFIDAEHALDLNYAKRLGVQTGRLLVSQPDHGEEALQVVETLLDSTVLKPGDLIVVDSVAALVPKAEIEGEIGDAHVGLQARLMSQSLRMLTGKLFQTGVILFFTNQVRAKIGGMGFGPQTTTTGGNALKFYASQRIEARRVGSLSSGAGDDAIKVANKVELVVQKNKVAPPFQVASVVVRFGQGISRADEVLDLGLHYKILSQSGSWVSFDNEKLANGRENVVAVLQQDPGLSMRIENKVREALSLPLMHLSVPG